MQLKWKILNIALCLVLAAPPLYIILLPSDTPVPHKWPLLLGVLVPSIIGMTLLTMRYTKSARTSLSNRITLIVIELISLGTVTEFAQIILR